MNANHQLETDTLSVFRELAEHEGNRFWDMLSGVFDNLRQGIIIADRNGRVVLFNRMAQKILGYRVQEVTGRLSLWDFCEECARPPLFRENLLRGQSFPEEEVEMSGKKGTVGVKVTPLYGQDGSLEGALATLRSLDEIRARERERKTLVRMASIGRIISAVAHEINNPLQTVRTSLELGLDPRKSASRRQEYLQAADHEISRITRVIGHLRNFYRPDPGEKRPTEVNAVLQEALALLSKQLTAAGVRVQLDLAPDLPSITLIDYQLQQVFLNLILNALEAMPDGGQLLILTRQDSDNTILVEFHDSAAVLDPYHAANLFDPFASNGRVGELALGLSVSREIITEIGGSIEMKTGDGNVLTMRLPY